MRLRDENKETLIREQAIALIVQEGFDGLSMQKLAKAANLSASTIYIYFKSREDLLNQVYIAVDEIFAKEVLKNFDPAMSFEEGLLATIDWYAQHTAWWRTIKSGEFRTYYAQAYGERLQKP